MMDFELFEIQLDVRAQIGRNQISNHAGKSKIRVYGEEIRQQDTSVRGRNPSSWMVDF